MNGSQVATGASWQVNSTDASVGDSLTCTAVAIDFEGNTTTSTSVPSTISNTAPVVTGVLLNNLSPIPMTSSVWLQMRLTSMEIV